MTNPTKCPCGKPGKILIRGTNYCANCMPEPETSKGLSAEDALMVEGYKRLYGGCCWSDHITSNARELVRIIETSLGLKIRS